MPAAAHTAPPVSERHAQYFDGWHCDLAANPIKGRHLVATRDFAVGDTVLVSEAYLTALFPSYKKRICAACLHDGGRRLELRCAACGEAWYCSTGCQAAHLSGAEPPGLPTQRRSMPRIPHALLCPVLKQFGGLKADADMECIIRMCLDLLALQRLTAADGNANDSSPRYSSDADGSLAAQAERHPDSAPAAEAATVRPGEPPASSATEAAKRGRDGATAADRGSGTAPSSSPDAQHMPTPEPPPLLQQSHADFELLQFHPAALSERDAQQWRRAVGFLQTALRRAGWVADAVPPLDTLLAWIGRIAANSFGLHIDSAAAREATAAAGGAGSASSGTLQQPVAGPRGSQHTLVTGGRVADELNEIAAQARKHADEVSTLSELQRLQLAQRRRWEGGELAEQARKPSLLQHTTNGADSSQQTESDAAEDSVPGKTVSIAGDVAAPTPATPTAGSSGRSSAPEAATTNDSAAARESPAESSAAGWDCGGISASDATDGGGGGLGVADHGNRARSEAVGRELFITASYFNHSCQPNCIIRRNAAFGVVKAQADIQAGTELCISYIDLEVPRSARQAELKKFFHFTCGCSRCREQAVAGSGKCRYNAGVNVKSGRDSAPKRRGRKARVSR